MKGSEKDDSCYPARGCADCWCVGGHCVLWRCCALGPSMGFEHSFKNTPSIPRGPPRVCATVREIEAGLAVERAN